MFHTSILWLILSHHNYARNVQNAVLTARLNAYFKGHAELLHRTHKHVDDKIQSTYWLYYPFYNFHVMPSLFTSILTKHPSVPNHNSKSLHTPIGFGLRFFKSSAFFSDPNIPVLFIYFFTHHMDLHSHSRSRIHLGLLMLKFYF